MKIAGLLDPVQVKKFMATTVNTIRNVVYLQVHMNYYADALTEMDGMVDMLKFKEKKYCKELLSGSEKKGTSYDNRSDRRW